MDITLKSLKVSASLSEETTAYTAIICVDGVKAFHASNHGHGGCDFYRPLPGYKGPSVAEVDAWLKANRPAHVFDGITLEHDLEMEVGEIITRVECQKRLTRMLKTKVLLIDQHNGEPALFTLKAKPAQLEQVKALKAQGKIKGEIVNGNPEAEARALALV